MHLKTYQSKAIEGIFVTLPSSAANATISLLDELGALHLDPVSRDYEFPDPLSRRPFVVSVLTQIVDKGYAMHGMDQTLAAIGALDLQAH
jgi:hypothetical protein